MFLILNLIVKCIFSSFILFQSGTLLIRILKLNSSKIDFCLRGFLGIIFLSFIALFINFFLPLNSLINTSLFTLIIISSFYTKSFPLKDIVWVGLITSLILILSTTNNPDGGLYHLPFIQILNEKKIIFGLNNLHFRFALSTMFQYVSAVFNNLYLDQEGITIPIAIIVSFFIYFLQKEIFFTLKNDTEKNFLFSIFYLLLLVSSLYSFNRYSNYGNDVSLHIYYFLIFIFSIKFLSSQDKDLFLLVLIFSVFLVINKITYVLSLLYPLLIFLFIKKKQILNLTTYFLFFFGLIWLIKNLLISGCLIFPIPSLCFDTLQWSNLELAITEKSAGEAWSKGWPDQKGYNNYESFSSGYNWLNIWLKTHIFIILEKFTPILLFAILFQLIFLFKGSHIDISKFKENKNYFLLLYFISLVNFVLWFHYFPIYRYGYSFLIIFFYLSIFLFFIKYIKKPKIYFLKKYYFIILIFSYIFFGAKNLDRIVKNFDQEYTNKPFPNIYYSYYDENNKDIFKKMVGKSFYYYYAPDLCFYNKSPCTNYLNKKLKHSSFLSYDILYLR